MSATQTQSSIPANDFSVGTRYKIVSANYFPSGPFLEVGEKDYIHVSGDFSDDNSWDDTSTDSHNDDSKPDPRQNIKFPCSATLRWRQVRADFSCFYHPFDEIYSDFQLAKCSSKYTKSAVDTNGMKMQQHVTIPVEYLKDKVKEKDGRVDKVLDDNGHEMISVRLELGEVREVVWLWAKEEVTGGGTCSMSDSEEKKCAEFEWIVEHLLSRGWTL